MDSNKSTGAARASTGSGLPFKQNGLTLTRASVNDYGGGATNRSPTSLFNSSSSPK